MPKEVLFQKGVSMNRLQTLVRVADKGSISAAAGQDDLARQSQFSHQLKDLEISFGRKLTERRGRTLRLTPAGNRLATLMREHLLALSRFADEVNDEAFTVRIGAGESTLNWLLTPNLAKVDSPSLRVRWCFSTLHAEDIHERLLDQRLDFGIVRGLQTARLKLEKLGTLENRLFIPLALMPGPPSSALEAIASLPLALLEDGSRTRRDIENACLRESLKPHLLYECNTATQLASVIANNLAAGPLPELARAQFDRKKVFDIGLGGILKKDAPLCLVWNPRTLAMSSSLETLRQSLTKVLSTALRTKA
ncbi:MAG: LysR family transcriptional regulator [bacterium]